MTEFRLDRELEQYSTDRQWELLLAWEQEGTTRAAADKLGINRANIDRAHRAVLRKAAKAGYSPAHDLKHTVPEGYLVKGTSTLYDQNGKPKLQWVKSAVDREAMEDFLYEAAKAFASELPKASKIEAPCGGMKDQLAVYPIVDHHIGELVWGQETLGADYDMQIAEQSLIDCSQTLFDAMPSTNQAAILFMGDLLHYDGMNAVTPTSGNVLSTDTRFGKMISTAIRLVRWHIEKALAKHHHVTVIVEIGNHDLGGSLWMAACLENIYQDNTRLTVDTSPAAFHKIQFGNTLIGTHHGHGAKMKDLPLLMATDWPEAWGQTVYRHILTGHIHHDSSLELPGCKVESLRTLAPANAWAATKGYRALREMQAMLFSRNNGMISRVYAKPTL